MPIIVASLDIGYRNLSLAIESYSYKSINQLNKQYEKLSKSDRIIEGREHSTTLQAVLEPFLKQGKTLLVELQDLNKEKGVGLQLSTRKNLNKYLFRRKKYLEKCSIIIIEQQFKTGQECNFDAILLGEDVFAWCCFNLDVPVEYTPSKNKTSILGMPRSIIETSTTGLRIAKKITKPYRKKWAVTKVKELLSLRCDDKTAKKIASYKKQDDVSDVILQSLAWILKTYVI